MPAGDTNEQHKALFDELVELSTELQLTHEGVFEWTLADIECRM